VRSLAERVHSTEIKFSEWKQNKQKIKFSESKYWRVAERRENDKWRKGYIVQKIVAAGK
jgi:hypothetical protein